MKVKKRNAGFTLAELLIVIAIVAALVGVGIYAFTAHVEKANQAVDMSTMRSAYSELMMRHINGEIEIGQRYIYDPNNTGITALSMQRPMKGYGRAKTDASKWWTGEGTASGVPKRGSSSVLQMWLDSNEKVRFVWGGKYAGLNVLDDEDYKQIIEENPEQSHTSYKFNGKTYTDDFYDVMVERDEILLDALQDEFRGMTYGDVYNLFYDNKGKLKAGVTRQNMGGNACYVIAYGAVDEDGNIGEGKNGIVDVEGMDEIFKNAGYDTDSANSYIINSRTMTGTKTNYVWVNTGVSEGDLKNSKNSNKVVKNAVTYVKSDEEATPNELRYDNRK